MHHEPPILLRAGLVAALLLVSAMRPAAAVPVAGVDAGFPVELSFVGANKAAAHAVALQPDGKILIAGYAGSNDNWDLAIARLLPNGAPDPQFSADGKLVLPLLPDVRSVGGWIRAMPDGRIVVLAGLLSDNGTASGVAVVRLMPDGTPDTSFSLDGRVLLPSTTVGCSLLLACSAALLDDGSVVLALLVAAGSEIESGAFVLKLRPDGAVDTSFGDGGFVIVPRLRSANQFQLQSHSLAIHLRDDGRLLLAVTTRAADTFGVTTFQLRADGSVDSSFANGAAGVIDTGFDLMPVVNALHAGVDGRVSVGVALLSTIGGSALFGAARFLPSGLPDPTFGSGGIAALVAAPECVASEVGCLSWAMHVDRSGRPHLIGSAERPRIDNQNDSDVAIGRLTAAGQLDTTYAPEAVRYYGLDIIGGGSLTILNEEAGHAVVQDGAGRLVIVGQRDGSDTEAMQVWRIHTEDMFRDAFE